MLRTILLLYVVCFGSYVLFTREPDYFESEKITVPVKISNSNYTADYNIENKIYSLDANYLFRTYNSGDKIIVIYNPDKPKQASVYTAWGYWFRWQELIVSTILIFGLFYLATSITFNPNADALSKLVDDDALPQRKYT